MEALWAIVVTRMVGRGRRRGYPSPSPHLPADVYGAAAVTAVAVLLTPGSPRVHPFHPSAVPWPRARSRHCAVIRHPSPGRRYISANEREFLVFVLWLFHNHRPHGRHGRSPRHNINISQNGPEVTSLLIFSSISFVCDKSLRRSFIFLSLRLQFSSFSVCKCMLWFKL